MSEMLVPRSLGLRLEANAPLLVLLAALATLFPFFYESGPLHRPPEAYDVVTFEHLMVAKNLSAEHDWLSIEFVVAPRIPRARTLTPDNRRYFLYRIGEYRRHRGPPRRIVGQYRLQTAP